MSDDTETIRAAADLVEQPRLRKSRKATETPFASRIVRLEEEKEPLMLEVADLRLQIGAYKALVHSLSADLAGEVQRREIAESLLPDADVFSWIDDMVQCELDIQDHYEDGPSDELLDTAEWCEAFAAYLQPQPKETHDADDAECVGSDDRAAGRAGDGGQVPPGDGEGDDAARHRLDDASDEAPDDGGA